MRTKARSSGEPVPRGSWDQLAPGRRRLRRSPGGGTRPSCDLVSSSRAHPRAEVTAEGRGSPSGEPERPCGPRTKAALWRLRALGRRPRVAAPGPRTPTCSDVWDPPEGRPGGLGRGGGVGSSPGPGKTRERPTFAQQVDGAALPIPILC